jgi:hypothetical protein
MILERDSFEGVPVLDVGHAETKLPAKMSKCHLFGSLGFVDLDRWCLRQRYKLNGNYSQGDRPFISYPLLTLWDGGTWIDGYSPLGQHPAHWSAECPVNAQSLANHDPLEWRGELHLR